MRRASTATLLGVGLVAAALFVGVNVVLSTGGTGGGGNAPPPATLAELVLRELGNPAPSGLSAHFHYVNTLVPDTSSLPAITGGGPAPLLEGADGRLWWTSGMLRLEFQTQSGDTQLVVRNGTALMYDAAAGNAFRLRLPPLGSLGDAGVTLAGAAQLLSGLRGDVAISAPRPGVTAGRSSYKVVATPLRDAGLVRSASLIVDARTGLPLRFDLYARNSLRPALEVVLSDVHFGPVDPSTFDLRLPDGMQPGTITFSTPPSLGGVNGCAGPDQLAGLPLSSCRLTGTGTAAGRLLVYGRSIGSVVVLEQPENGDPAGGLWGLLPAVSVGAASARELVTTLGTVLRFGRGGVTYTVLGSRPRALVVKVAEGL